MEGLAIFTIIISFALLVAIFIRVAQKKKPIITTTKMLNRYQVQVYEDNDRSKMILLQLFYGFTADEAIQEAKKHMQATGQLDGRICPLAFFTHLKEHEYKK